MRKFTSGMIAGSIIGVAGVAYAMSDKRTRKRLMRDGRKVMDRANNLYK